MGQVLRFPGVGSITVVGKVVVGLLTRSGFSLIVFGDIQGTSEPGKVGNEGSRWR